MSIGGDITRAQQEKLHLEQQLQVLDVKYGKLQSSLEVRPARIPALSLSRAHSMADISLCVNHTASRTIITATRGCDRAICTRTSYADLRQASAQRHTTTSLLPASTDRSPAGARRSTETKGTTRTLTRATNTNAVHHGPLVVLIVLLAPLRVRVRVCSPIARRSSTSSRESLLLRAPPLPPKLP